MPNKSRQKKRVKVRRSNRPPKLPDSAEIPLQAKAGTGLQKALGNLRTVTPAEVIGIQRAVGNRATRRLLKGQNQSQQADKHQAINNNLKFGQVVQREDHPGKKNQTNMPDHLKTGVENLSGLSIDDVRVHYNSNKPAELMALAHTEGTDIHVGPGQEHSVPHEAWHVIQQKQERVKPTTEEWGQPLNNSPDLEQEADVMGAKALNQSLRTTGEDTSLRPSDSVMGIQTRVIQLLNSAQKKVLNKIKAQVAAEQDAEERWKLIENALRAINAGTDMNIQDGAKHLKVAVTKPVEEVQEKEEEEDLDPFVSLDADVEEGRYLMKETKTKKIQIASGEKEFEKYSDGKPVAVAVTEAIDNLDLDSDIHMEHSRHDFQPSSKERKNLQVQLGGSAGKYRVGKGDTSSTVVVIETVLWERLKKANPNRLKKMVQEAHKNSYNGVLKVELTEKK